MDMNYVNNAFLLKMKHDCSICLNKIQLFTFKKKKLPCGHVFHEKCIKHLQKRKCPKCESIFFSREEKFIISNYDNQCWKFAILMKEKQACPYDINLINIYMSIYKNNKNNNLLEFIYKNCDLTDILVNNLNNKVMIIHLIKNNATINWFKLFNGGSTLFELIQQTHDEDLMHMIIDKFALNVKNNTPNAPSLEID